MEFLIDKKIWNKVLKKVSPKTELLLRRLLTEKCYEVESVFVQSSFEYKQRKKSKGRFIKKEFLLNLNQKSNDSGFFLKQSFENKDQNVKTIDLWMIWEIEKGLIEVLIENKGLNKKVKYRDDYVIRENYSDKAETLLNIQKGFVYLIRNEDIYKIGITDNLLRRFNQLKPDEVINVVRCSNYEDLEKSLHKKFKDNRIPQSEYFRLDKYQIEQVNIEMAKGAKF